MPNIIVLDKTDPAIAEAVAGCEVGKPQSFTITATPLSDDESSLVATVDQIAYQEGAEEPAVEEEAAAPPSPTTEAPYKPKAKSSTAAATF